MLIADIKSHTDDELMTSINLWYFGDGPYNNTELFVWIQPDIMTWGQWKTAAGLLALFYDTFGIVSLSFEAGILVKGAPPEYFAHGRFSLYDRAEEV